MSHIILPSKLKVVEETDTKGIYEIEGLYPGYGHTLGNSLRRVILSSLPGAAITRLSIDGAEHEFTTLEGVREDVLTIILNLKRVNFRILTDEPQQISLKLSGKKTVTAGDISLPGQVELMNPDQFICELTDSKSSLSIDMTVEKGLGFVPRKISKLEKNDIGVITVDAIFTPIKKVSYEVENMRVGDQINYNRLTLSISTDGSLTAKEALEQSIKIMISQFHAILDLEEVARKAPEPVVEETEPENTIEPVTEYADILKTRVDSLEFSTRTLNALSDASIRTIGGLAKKSEKELLALDGIGAKGLQEIKDILATFDISLKE